ncbi:MAG: Ig-like domain-containing protein [Bacteroidales bacterium]
MRYTLSVLLLLSVNAISAQTSLTIEGKTYTNADDTWYGVNIPRTTPTALIFKNNSITSINRYGYLLSAGDEVPGAYNNNLDGGTISGNVLTWNGTPTIDIIPHGIFTGYNINVKVKYNYLNKVPMAIIRKSNGMTDISGVVAYNIIKDPGIGVVVKGMNGVRIYNNTFYSSLTTSQANRALIDIYENPSVTPPGSATGTKIFNNIFYTKNILKNISITSACRAGFESDYNVFYCEAGTPIFSVDGVQKTFAQWQAMGYDLHSVVINPNFKDYVNFIPAARLDYGTELGTSFKDGLSVNAKWGATDPETSVQNGRWQVGAIIYKEVVTQPAPVPVFTGALIGDATPSRLEMTYSLTLTSIVPAASAFTAKVNNVIRNVSSVAISGTKVLLTLASPVVYGDAITVAYTRPSVNPLQTAAGGQAESLASQPVVNNRSAPANQPPSVSISSPTKSHAFISPATVTIDAAASDPDGTINKVEFYNGTVKLGERTTAPWSFTWKEVQSGTYTLTAAATDNSNSRTVSEAVTVVVEKAATAINQAPSVAITSFTGNATIEAPATITFTADATDTDGSVVKVEYYAGQEKLGESLTYPWSFSFEFNEAGTYEIIAKASDNLNSTAMSAPVTLSVILKREYPDLINLYPNPNDGNFTVDMNLIAESDGQVIITVVNLSGKTIYRDIISPGETVRQIDITNSLSGNYILVVTGRDRILSTRQFIKN